MRELIAGAALALIVSGVSTRGVLGSRRAMSAQEVRTQR
jgi:hypothetical protein